MAEFSDKLSFIRGVCESWHGWNIEQRKAVCRALFWLCDLLLEDVQQRCPAERRQYVSGSLRALKERADKGAISGELDVALAHEDAVSAMGWVPDEPLP